MKEPNTTRTPDKAYKVILILLVSLAAFSSALRDLNRLQELVGSLQEFSGELLGVGLNTAEAKGISASESLCLQGLAESVQGVQGVQGVNATEEFRWSGRIAQGSAIEIKGINGDLTTEAATGDQVEVIAKKKARRSNPDGVAVKVVEHWPDSLEFTTVNGEISLDLPATVNTEIKADTFNGEISSDFPLSLLNRTSRKHLSGRIGNGGRELILKTLNGGISLRRAG